MSYRGIVRIAVVLTGALGAVSAAPRAVSQGPPKPAPAPRPAASWAPKLEPIAETRLLMEGLNLPNFKGLEKLLKEKPADEQAWVFARGQALLIAENGNLLLLRPPKNSGEESWMEHASELRDTASKLARNLGKRDYEASRSGLTDLANTCNSCHKTFRSPARIVPFAESGQQPPPLPPKP